MDAEYEPGQRLVLELLGGKIFEGDYEEGTKTRLDLVNVVEYPKSVPLQGLRSFYKMEVVTVQVLNENKKEESAPEQLLTNGKAHSAEVPVNVMDVPKQEYNRLKEMTQGYIYMATVDKRYLDAVQHLNSCESVGVVGIGSECGKQKTISLLVLSTWDQIYMFDLLLFRKRKFPPDLKEILECTGVTKVVHDSRWLLDCLSFCDDVHVQNVFDTQVADVMIEKKKTGKIPDALRSFPACLHLYLNFPKTILGKAYEVTSQEWLERPLTLYRKIYAAQLVAYLITLKNRLQCIMNQDFNNSCLMYGKLLKNINQCDMRVMDRVKVPENVFK